LTAIVRAVYVSLNEMFSEYVQILLFIYDFLKKVIGNYGLMQIFTEAINNN